MTVLWTVLPPELVLEGYDNCPAYEEIDHAGVKLMVEMISPRQCRIVRLLSTNPQDYLQPCLQPGVILTYRPADSPDPV